MELLRYYLSEFVDKYHKKPEFPVPFSLSFSLSEMMAYNATFKLIGRPISSCPFSTAIISKSAPSK